MRRRIIPIIIVPALLWSTTAFAGERFCLRLPPDNSNIYDASPRPSGFDYLEDYGRRGGGDWGMPGMYAHIETISGTDVWGSTWCGGGFCLVLTAPLDGNGCTPYLDTPGGTAEETFRIRYTHSGQLATGMSWAVYDCSSTNPYYPGCASATNVIENVVGPAGSNLTHYQNLPMSVENMLGWEVGFSMKRFPLLDSVPVAVKYYDTTAANAQNISTATVWSSQGTPQINIRGQGWRNKGTPAHEYGHVYSVFRNSSLSASDLNYCYSTGTPCQHDLKSPEWQAAASVEGFAQFFSAAVWNNAGLNAQAYLAEPIDTSTGLRINLEYGQTGYELKYYETQLCSGTCYNGVGTELDWARTFWDFYTNYSPAPTLNSIGAVFEDIYPWTVFGHTNSYYTQFHNGVESVLNSTWESRFEYCAAANGVDW